MTDGIRRRVEDLLRELAPQVLGTLVSRYGQFGACEDAVQEALLKAVRHWPENGIPQSPRGWLLTVATRVLIDESRSDSSRRRRENAVFAATPQSELLARPADAIADDGEARERLGAVQHVLYLIFNEGYTASSGEDLTAPNRSDEAIRLTRLLRRLLPEDGETAGLLALMLLTDARRPARTLPDGTLVPLAEQDRTRWTRAAITAGRRAAHGQHPRTAVPDRPRPGSAQLTPAFAARVKPDTVWGLACSCGRPVLPIDASRAWAE